MTRRGRVIAEAILASIALGSSVLAAYLYAVLRSGEWRYRGLVALLGASVAATIVAIAVAAIRCNWRAAVWLTLASCTAANTVYLLAFANCRSACGSRVTMESKSPDAQWTATVRVEGGCMVTAGSCPAVSYVAIRPASSRTGVQVLKVRTDGVIQFQWNSADELTIRYQGPGVVRYLDSVGSLRLRYMPVGFM